MRQRTLGHQTIEDLHRNIYKLQSPSSYSLILAKQPRGKKRNVNPSSRQASGPLKPLPSPGLCYTSPARKSTSSSPLLAQAFTSAFHDARCARNQRLPFISGGMMCRCLECRGPSLCFNGRLPRGQRTHLSYRRFD